MTQPKLAAVDTLETVEITPAEAAAAQTAGAVAAAADTVTATESTALFADADAYLPGAGLGAYALPDDIRLVFSHARGARLWDVDGREFIDYVGGAGALILGHAHPAVVQAAQAQLARGAHVFGSLTAPAIALAKRLTRAIPCAEKIVYATTGSEATAYAMRLARAFTGRDKILKFAGAYHGNHDYALVSAFPAPGDAVDARADSAGQPAATTSTMLVAPYNDLDAVQRIVAAHGRDIAAIIAEGVQRIIPARPEFLHGLRKVCDANGILLILDEVVTGFRLGPGGAQEWYGVAPDLATYGKVIGAGGPLSCIAGRAELIEQANPRRKGEPRYAYFNGTLHGNPVAAAATLALLDELDAPEVYARLNRATEELCRECQTVLDAHNLPARACSAGSLWQIVFAPAAPMSHADLAAGAADNRRLDAALMKRGQYVLPGVRRFVSTAHSDADFEATVRGLDAACRDFVKSA